MNEPQPQTRTALATLGMDALDRTRVDQVKVSNIAGGVSFATALEIMEFSKLMAVADTAVPKHLRLNPGICLAVTFQAVEWNMSPFAVANKSYVVNDRLAYESQLVHAVIEARAPLKKRLESRYEGEGTERKCIVTGTFSDGEVRNYESPMLKDIKVQNSPLWKGDPDQQLWYFSSRAWCRRWCPDVLLGIYTRDELAADANLGLEEPQTVVPLRDRLQGAAEGSEGHRHGHAESELRNIIPIDGKVTIQPAGEDTPAPGGAAPAASAAKSKTKAAPKPAKATGGKGKPNAPPSKKAVDHAADKAEDAGRAAGLTNSANVMPKSAASAAADRAQATADARKPAQEAKVQADEQAAPPVEPKTAAEYGNYCRAWILKGTNADDLEGRWDGERDLRDNLEVPLEARKEIERLMNIRCEELRK